LFDLPSINIQRAGEDLGGGMSVSWDGRYPTSCSSLMSTRITAVGIVPCLFELVDDFQQGACPSVRTGLPESPSFFVALAGSLALQSAEPFAAKV
jgi:hypothetical protein